MMDREPGTQVIYESCGKIKRLLKCSELGEKPYTAQELLDLIPFVQAEAFDIGKACAAMEKRLRHELGLPEVVK